MYWLSSLELFSFFHLKTWNVLTFVAEEPFLRLTAKGDSGITEDGVAVEAIIHGFPVLTGLTEPNWCWVSIQAAGVFCGPLQSSLKEDSQVESLHEALRALPHWGETLLL